MKELRSVLVVEDEALVRSSLAAMLRGSLFRSEFAADAEEALVALRERDFDAVLTDIRMPGKSGIELLREARRVRPDTPIVLMTGYASIETAIQSMRDGAADYIEKPFKRRDVLRALERALDQPETVSAPSEQRGAARPPRSRLDNPLIGARKTLDPLRTLIDKVASVSDNLLITGESGTGKELVARMIHAASTRSRGRFVVVDCASLRGGQLESELFGRARGAFGETHASAPGLLDQCDGGTLFLDEVADLDPAMQSRLMRVVQEHEFRPLGASRSRRIDARIVASTSRDLRQLMKEGSFREDLFFRLNVVRLHLPPLREREGDVRLLAEHFARQSASGAAVRIRDDVLDALEQRSWEGNVRELKNVIERALAVGDGTLIGLDQVLELEGEDPANEPGWQRLVQLMLRDGLPLREIEDQVIAEALRVTGGNKVRAAKILGISRRTLYRRRPPLQ